MSVKQTREDRLAAKLRENLRRRKAQARAGSSSQEVVPEGEQNDTPAQPEQGGKDAKDA